MKHTFLVNLESGNNRKQNHQQDSTGDNIPATLASTNTNVSIRSQLHPISPVAPNLIPPHSNTHQNPATIVATSEQRKILDQILPELTQTPQLQRKIWILTADRGRGKSALAGMLCKACHQSMLRVVVSGPARRSADVLFNHCRLHADTTLTDSSNAKQHNVDPATEPVFIPPDALLAGIDNPGAKTDSHLGVLVIDEAAALPLPVLMNLIQKYPKVILVTTVHGYEGAGRGFALRMRSWLEQNAITNQWYTLQTPIRWPPGDSLEALCNDVFMLNAEYSRDRSLPDSTIECRVSYVSSQMLADQDSLLRECFALLVQAHYQTKPMDLRHMLDGQNLKVYVLRCGGLVVGTALVAIEGPFPGQVAGSTVERATHSQEHALRRDIVEKRRRPRGHLLPQLLAQWTLDESALDLCVARVVRIAIHPEFQCQGLGSDFLQQVESQLFASERVDAIGALFGDHGQVFNFWKINGFKAFHLGEKRNNRSGQRSIAVIKKKRETLPVIDKAWLLFDINHAGLRLSIPAPTHQRSQSSIPDEEEWRILSHEILGAYLYKNRSFSDSQVYIRDYLRQVNPDTLANDSTFSSTEISLMDMILKADFNFKQCATTLGFSGKTSAENAFKKTLEKMYL